MKGNETIGTMQADNLIYDTLHPLDVKSITLAAGQGELKRGTLIASDGTVWNDGTGAADCILTDDVGTEGAAAVATAYRSGHFIRQNIIVASGKTLTAKAETELRNGGIYLSNAMI